MLSLLHFLTVVLVVLKLGSVTAVATWSWWLIFLPSIIAFGIPVALIMFGAIIALIVVLMA